MFGFFKGTPKASPPPQAAAIYAQAAVNISAEDSKRALNAHQKELMPIVLKFIMRQCGIPPGWIKCGEIFEIRKNGKPTPCVQLVVKHWDVRLFQYAEAMEDRLIKGLDLFETAVDHSDYMFSWTVGLEARQGDQSMPSPQVWSQAEVVDPIAERLMGAPVKEWVKPAPLHLVPPPRRQAPILDDWKTVPDFANTNVLTDTTMPGPIHSWK